MIFKTGIMRATYCFTMINYFLILLMQYLSIYTKYYMRKNFCIVE